MESEVFEWLTKKLEANSNKIPQDLYTKHGIKHGLRNDDGTGVPVIISRISDVVGYKKEGNRVIPTEGKLIYRGIEIRDLVKGFQAEDRDGFEDTAYLLMFGELPLQKELSDFSNELVKQRSLPEGFVKDVILTYPGENLMNQLQSAVSVLYTTDSKRDDISLVNVVRQCMSLIAKIPIIVAYSYHTKEFSFKRRDLHIHATNGSPSSAENFLGLLRPDGTYTPLEAQTLDMLLVLHADHSGGNNSTFTTRCVSSTGTDTYSTIAAAIGSLKGPLHGGANAEVMEMMGDIQKNVKDWKDDDEIAAYLARIIKKEAGDLSGLIYGMGHAVYTLSDPRAELLKSKAGELAEEKGRAEEFGLYEKVGTLAPKVFAQIKQSNKFISPNVDFYSGFVYDCMGFPQDIATPLFAMARMAGWAAHRVEAVINESKIMRPASVYVGPENVKFVPLAERG